MRNKKRIIIIAIILLFGAIASISIVCATTLNGNKIVDYIESSEIVQLRVQKFVYSKNGPSSIVQDSDLHLGKDGVDDLKSILENNSFKKKDALYAGFFVPEEYVEYFIHGLNSQGEQRLFIKSISKTKLNSGSQQQSAKKEIEHGVEISTHEDSPENATKKYILVAKNMNWLKDIEEWIEKYK